MVNRGKEIDIDISNFEPNLQVPHGRRRWRLIFHSFQIAVHFTLFVIGFQWSLQKTVSRVWFRLYISDFLALNRRHKPFLALLGDCSSYSYFLNRGSKLTYQASLGKPTVVARRSFVNLYRISMQDGAFSLGYNNGWHRRLNRYPYQWFTYTYTPKRRINNIVYYLQRHLGTCEIITNAEFGAKIKE